MIRSCRSACAAQAPATAAKSLASSSSSSSASSPLLFNHCRRSSTACRAASTPPPRPTAIPEERDDDSAALRNRRALLAQGASLAAATMALASPLAAFADDGIVAVVDAAPSVAPPAPAAALDVEFATLSDPTLAYSFRYPVSVAKSGTNLGTSASGVPTPSVLRLSLVPSRKPERYSSAAPLSPDARQRIVCELVDLQQSVTVSVTVGPPATTTMLLPAEERQRLLRASNGGEASTSSSSSNSSLDPQYWSPRAVAEAVLVDRSTARTTSGQRLALNSVESAEAFEKEGKNSGKNQKSRYFLYEHLAQGSPSERSVVSKTGAKETYRRAWASTGVRNGKKGDGSDPYLYTLNLSCPQDLWPLLGDAFRAAVESFELEAEPGKGFVSPDSQPWRFF